MTAARCKEAVVGKDGLVEEAWKKEGIVMSRVAEQRCSVQCAVCSAMSCRELGICCCCCRFWRLVVVAGLLRCDAIQCAECSSCRGSVHTRPGSNWAV
jgi:hypothetical protein